MPLRSLAASLLAIGLAAPSALAQEAALSFPRTARPAGHRPFLCRGARFHRIRVEVVHSGVTNAHYGGRLPIGPISEVTVFFDKNTRRALAAALALLGASAFHAAKADVIYQSASDNYRGLSEVLEGGKYTGAVFTLDQTTSITGIGAQFVNSASGSIFGVIVPVGPGNTTPSLAPSQIAVPSNYVAGTDVVFDVASQLKTAPEIKGIPVIDYAAQLSQAVTLQAGTYAVIFGSDAFGASGFADIGLNNTPASDADILSYNNGLYGNTWKTNIDTGAELFVDGTAVAAVPEPSASAALIAGLAGFGFVLYRRRGMTAARQAV